MSWLDLIRLIRDEAGEEIAKRIEERARFELGGVRVYIARTREVTFEQVEKAAPGQPRKAAKALGIHPSTAYRILQRERIIR